MLTIMSFAGVKPVKISRRIQHREVIPPIGQSRRIMIIVDSGAFSATQDVARGIERYRVGVYRYAARATTRKVVHAVAEVISQTVKNITHSKSAGS